jgi:hypothetical protein
LGRGAALLCRPAAPRRFAATNGLFFAVADSLLSRKPDRRPGQLGTFFSSLPG